MKSFQADEGSHSECSVQGAYLFSFPKDFKEDKKAAICSEMFAHIRQRQRPTNSESLLKLKSFCSLLVCAI